MIVAGVDRGGPAEGALEVGDEIRAVNGETCVPQTISWILAQHNTVGQAVTLDVARRGAALRRELRFDSASCADDLLLMASTDSTAHDGAATAMAAVRAKRRSAEGRVLAAGVAMQRAVVVALDEAEALLQPVGKTPEHLRSEADCEELRRRLRVAEEAQRQLAADLQALRPRVQELEENERIAQRRAAEGARRLQEAQAAAEEDASALRARLARLQAQLADSKPAVELSRSEDKRLSLEAELARVEAALKKDYVPRDALAALEKERARLEELVATHAAQLATMAPRAELATANAGAARAEEALHACEARFAGMVLRAELEQAQGEAKAVRAQMEELRTQLEKTRPLAQFDALKAQKRELHTELHKARAEAQEAADKLAALRMQTKPLLSMAETQQLQRALNDAVARVTEREAEVERLREAAAATRGTIKELKGQNDALAAQLGSMADPAAFSKAKAGERAAGQQLAEVRGELEREQKLLAQARATIKALKSESDGFRLQLRDRLPAAKVQAAVAEAKAAEKEAARLRQALENAEAGRERARQESSQTREELARVRAQAGDRVPRQELAEAQAAARAAREQVEVRGRDLAEAEQRIAAAGKEAARLAAESGKARVDEAGRAATLKAEVEGAKVEAAEAQEAARVAIEDKAKLEELLARLEADQSRLKVCPAQPTRATAHLCPAEWRCGACPGTQMPRVTLALVQAEAHALRTEAQDAVPRAELAHALEDARRAAERAETLAGEKHSVSGERDTVRAQAEGLEERLLATEEALKATVPRPQFEATLQRLHAAKAPPPPPPFKPAALLRAALPVHPGSSCGQRGGTTPHWARLHASKPREGEAELLV